MNIIYTLDAIEKAVNDFWQYAKAFPVVAFHGSMGAGKTTFIAALCRYLGVYDAVSSPTFSIINEYKAADGRTIFHIDLYRLKDEEEALNAGVENCFLPNTISFIEWPEIAPGILPENTLHVYIRVEDETTRKIEII